MQIYKIKVDKNKKETTNHGVYEFPIQIYETFLEKNVLKTPSPFLFFLYAATLS